MTLPWRRKPPSSDSTGVSTEANFISLHGEMPGMVFLKLKKITAGKLVWQRFIALTPVQVASLVEELTEAHGVAIRAETIGMEKR